MIVGWKYIDEKNNLWQGLGKTLPTLIHPRDKKHWLGPQNRFDV